MTRTQISKIKAQLVLAWGHQLLMLQYHPATDVISAYGHQLTTPDRAVGNIDKYGNGRYVVAQMGYGGAWKTIHGETISA